MADYEKETGNQNLINNPNYIPKLDYVFLKLILQKKNEIENFPSEPHSTSENSKIYVCVRKRPIFEKEIQKGRKEGKKKKRMTSRSTEPRRTGVNQ